MVAEILVHQAEFNNRPVHIGVRFIKGQLIPIDEGVHKCIINTRSKVFRVIETKEQVMKLIKEALDG